MTIKLKGWIRKQECEPGATPFQVEHLFSLTMARARLQALDSKNSSRVRDKLLR